MGEAKRRKDAGVAKGFKPTTENKPEVVKVFSVSKNFGRAKIRLMQRAANKKKTERRLAKIKMHGAT